MKKKKDSSDTASTPAKENMNFKRNLWQTLVEPAAAITDASLKRQVRLISALLLAIALMMVSGVIYMGFFSSNPAVAVVLAVAEIAMGIAYLISRTQRYQLAAILSLIILSLIPIFNVALAQDRSSEALLILLIWNTLTILLSSAITSFQNTILFVIIDILTLLLFPLIIPTITFSKMALPLIFNFVISLSILIFTQHRNLLEKDRLLELSQTNARLQIELKERKRVEEQLAYRSLHDPLTDLPNRALFMDRLAHAMQRTRRNQALKFAVFFLDLDRFKVVNDSQGHNVGDLLLIESGKRLVESVRAVDTVARLGGDEFVVLLEDIKKPSDYLQVANRILHNLSLPSNLGGQTVFVSVSMGIVLSDARYEQSDEILRDADIAMYRAKSIGRGRYEIFDPVMLDSVTKRLEMETDLWKALQNQEFILHYQPIQDVLTHRMIGFEALIRWQHPARGLIMPADFISIAEEIGLIVPMGYWVLEEACRQIRAWQKKYPSDPPLTVSVNLSPRQCAQTDLVQSISAILKKTKLDPRYLKLELTESLIVEDSEGTASMLSQLRDLGIQVHIDDFGTGYSSLGNLHELPIDALKIDRTFIRQLESANSGLEIVRTILSLAHNLGMKVIAEGVETDAQLSSLKSMNCEYAQGFLFYEPMPEIAIDSILAKSFDKHNQ